MARSVELESYLTDAQRWDEDRVARADRSRTRAYWVASAFGACAGLTLLALVALMPLKSVVPFMVRVDNTTGVTDVVPAYDGHAPPAEVVTRFLVHNYVVTRERYFYAMAEEDYNQVGAYNSPVLNSLWAQAWDRSNPQSPLMLYKDGTTVRSQVQSISFIKRADGSQDLAQARFLTATRQGGSGAEVIHHWIATLQYDYATPSKDAQLRGLNPLGFRILEYRREPEVLPDTPSTTPKEPGVTG